MNIKEVGSLTGISENIIRSYEEQGLITINEDSINNSEYNYNEENINELKRAEILRKLDIPISEIREFKEGRIALKNILENKFQELKSSKLRDDELNNIDSKSIIEVILKDLRKKDNVKLEDYFEEVNYFESEEYTKLISDLKEFNTVSLATQIIYTLMLSGPLLWLPINISRGNSKFIVLNIILSIISVILLIFSWRKYLKQTKKKTKGTIPLLISMIVGIILTLAIFAGVAKLQEVIFVPKDYLMFMFKPPYSYMIFLFEFEIIAILVSKIYKKVNNIEWEWAFELIGFIKKNKITAIVINIVLLYVCVTGITVVTEDKIVDYSFYNPRGTVYYYEDISKVKAGFKGKLFNIFPKNAGDFYYKVTFKDEKEVNFYQAQSAFKDSYLELEIFDELIMNEGKAEKESSKENYEFCTFDQRYIDRFLRIVDNK